MPSPNQSLGWTVPEQSCGSVFQPKHAVLHHTETQCLRDLSLEKGALKVVCCNKRTKSRMGKEFFLRRTYNTHKKTKKKIRQTKSEWFVCMVHDVLGDISRTADTLVLYKLSEVSMCALWMSEIGWPAPWEEREEIFFVWWRRDGLMDGAGLVPMLLWTEWVSGGKHSICVSPVAVWGWRRMEVPTCLSVWHPDWGGSPKLLRPWVWPQREGGHVPPLVSDPGTKTPPPVTVWQELFWCFWCSY